MKLTTNSNLVKMCRQGIESAFIGIISGLILGLIIYYFQFLLTWLSYYPANHMLSEAYNGNYGLIWASAAQPGTMGACFGAIIGAIFGCIMSLKEIAKK